MKWPHVTTPRILRVACITGLVSLPLMVWSIFDRTVWPILIALSVGQGIGTCSLALFFWAVGRDLRLRKQMEREDPNTQRPPTDAR